MTDFAVWDFVETPLDIGVIVELNQGQTWPTARVVNENGDSVYWKTDRLTKLVSEEYPLQWEIVRQQVVKQYRIKKGQT